METSRNIKSTFIILFLVGVFDLLSPAYSETYIGFGIGTTIPNDFSNINLGVAATTNYDDLNVHNSFAVDDREFNFNWKRDAFYKLWISKCLLLQFIEGSRGSVKPVFLRTGFNLHILSGSAFPPITIKSISRRVALGGHVDILVLSAPYF